MVVQIQTIQMNTKKNGLSDKNKPRSDTYRNMLPVGCNENTNN